MKFNLFLLIIGIICYVIGFGILDLPITFNNFVGVCFIFVGFNCIDNIKISNKGNKK